MRKNTYVRNLTEDQVLSYILRSISEGKNEHEIADRFDGDTKLIKDWVDALKQTHLVNTNYFDELVITPDGENYLEKFDLHR
jgi:predicted transcriptional regulator